MTAMKVLMGRCSSESGLMEAESERRYSWQFCEEGGGLSQLQGEGEGGGGAGG